MTPGRYDRADRNPADVANACFLFFGSVVMTLGIFDLVVPASATGDRIIVAGVFALFAALAMVAGIVVTVIRLRRHASLLLMALASLVFVSVTLKLDLSRSQATALYLLVGTLTTLLPIRWFAVTRRKLSLWSD